MNTCGFQFEMLGWELELPVGDNCWISMAQAVCSRTTTCSEGTLIFQMKTPKLRETKSLAVSQSAGNSRKQLWTGVEGLLVFELQVIPGPVLVRAWRGSMQADPQVSLCTVCLWVIPHPYLELVRYNLSFVLVWEGDSVTSRWPQLFLLWSDRCWTLRQKPYFRAKVIPYNQLCLPGHNSSSRWGHNDCCHFSYEEPETQRGYITQPRSQSL